MDGELRWPFQPMASNQVPSGPPDQEAPGRAAVPGPRGAPEPDAVAEPPGRPRWWQFPRTRRYLSGFPPAGLTGALIFYCLSLTPSLLPRAWYLQAVMSAVTAAIGYGVGLLIGWLLRSLIPWRPGPGLRRAARWALVAAAVVLIPLFGVLGARWQHQIRELVDVTQESEANYILVVVVTVVLTVALIMVARGIRALVRLIARLVGRVIPHRAGAAVAVLVVCVLLVLLATGALSRGAISAANSVFGGVDNGTAAGVTQPASPDALRRPGFARAMGHARPAGPDLRGGRSDGRRDQPVHRAAGDGADQGVRGPELRAVDRGGVRACGQ